MVSKKMVRRLRLREGDILVVKDTATHEALMNLRMKNLPRCPIIVAPNGIGRLSREYLKKRMER